MGPPTVALGIRRGRASSVSSAPGGQSGGGRVRLVCVHKDIDCVHAYSIIDCGPCSDLGSLVDRQSTKYTSSEPGSMVDSSDSDGVIVHSRAPHRPGPPQPDAAPPRARAMGQAPPKSAVTLAPRTAASGSGAAAALPAARPGPSAAGPSAAPFFQNLEKHAGSFQYSLKSDGLDTHRIHGRNEPSIERQKRTTFEILRPKQFFSPGSK